MFDLEQSISEWRRRMQTGGIGAPDVLDELESHLRETVERRMRMDPDAHQAFDAAVAEIGRAAALKTEFAKTSETLFEKAKRGILEFAGVPNPQLATNMNTNTSSNSESGWSTYLKAATFAFPAAFLWMFSAVFLLPKVNEICQRAGTVTFALPQAPMVFRASAGVGRVMVLLTDHGLLMAGIAALALVLLEWQFKGWSHYRRATMGTGVVALNALVLISLILMIVSLIVAMPPAAHHAGQSAVLH
jgi:hypothetical protein